MNVDVPIYYLEKLLYVVSSNRSPGISNYTPGDWFGIIQAGKYMQLSDVGFNYLTDKLNRYLGNFAASLNKRYATLDDYVRRLSILDDKELLEEDKKEEKRKVRLLQREEILNQPIPEHAKTIQTKSGKTMIRMTKPPSEEEIEVEEQENIYYEWEEEDRNIFLYYH